MAAVEAGVGLTGPLPEELSWQRVGEDGATGGVALPDGATQPEPGLLVIPAAAAGDEGEYECQAFDSAGGKPVSTRRVTLSLSAPSENAVDVEGPPLRVLQEGSTLRLKCEAPGTPLHDATRPL